ncbi:PREDICTED: uncharacterized protein LOC104816354 [Tarenaya hassleriana]|uniref:uncharacterized protein LOC104816354 n=1 Tax=Tarenaya hassleriana TaxID=28532 RepID=UPI00053C2066|nr:PREDICTED: uncharacterized protein LOC104816354 [Tarenaya hassleriana]
MEDTKDNCDPATDSSSAGNGKEKSDENIFVNHAEISWHEMRKQWVGDPSKRTSRMRAELAISFNATYEDLLLSNAPFHKPIPLAEMVDFLVDSWLGDGLFD